MFNIYRRIIKVLARKARGFNRKDKVEENAVYYSSVFIKHN